MLTENLLEKVIDIQNFNQAFHKVKSNKGAPGVDGMGVDELRKYLEKNLKSIKESILNGK